MRLVDRFERRAGRADLPDLGADLRLQPGVRALPVELRPARPARADHRASARPSIDELERMQVFYVNIGGGEPTVRRDFWELVDYATDHQRRRQVLHQRQPDHAGASALAGRQRLRRRADLARRRDAPRSTTRSAARGPTTTAITAHGATARRRHGEPQALGRRARGTTSPSSTRSKRSPTATARSCGSRACAPPAAAPTCGTTFIPPGASSASSTTGLPGGPTRCSPATRSSIWRRSARGCPG